MEHLSERVDKAIKWLAEDKRMLSEYWSKELLIEISKDEHDHRHDEDCLSLKKGDGHFCNCSFANLLNIFARS